MNKSLYFDCYSGISGDMSVGALIDAGADFAAIEAMLQGLGVPGFSVRVTKVVKAGVAATQFHVDVDDSHGHPHRHLRHVVEIIKQGNLPAPVAANAIATFEILAEAEAAVHGTSIEKVHFHEVGAIDSIVDIVAAQYALHLLEVEKVYASALHVGSGTVKCAHGVMPVPAPATARLLLGIPTYGGEVEGELVTPTGAALLRQRCSQFGAAPRMTVEAIGYGSGTKDIPGRANVLRVMIGVEAATLPATEPITVMEATVDDMNPELLPPLVEALLATHARDVFLTPVIGKKGRPAQLITVLCDAPMTAELAGLIFAGSSTLGLRIREEERLVLLRDWKPVRTPWGLVKVKRGGVNREALASSPSTVAPEYEDCKALAEQAGVPVRKVYEAALGQALQGNFEDE